MTRTAITGWLWFAIVQLIAFTATAIGWILLIPFCIAQAWIADTTSDKDGRKIDRWSWRPLNWIYGNREDGVSGYTALVWVDGYTQGPYLPKASAWARAYRWSALRNSCDNLKYVFAWKGGPFWRREFRSWYVQAGWNSSGFPVISAGRI